MKLTCTNQILKMSKVGYGRFNVPSTFLSVSTVNPNFYSRMAGDPTQPWTPEEYMPGKLNEIGSFPLEYTSARHNPTLQDVGVHCSRN
mmetsp:Transcript_34864/g.84411  ORF Transcript_34864/g.84411 Transcript_34864/m.84411 type:complete len:88 (-) Transcript_34864:80-343(-)